MPKEKTNKKTEPEYYPEQELWLIIALSLLF